MILTLPNVDVSGVKVRQNDIAQFLPHILIWCGILCGIHIVTKHCDILFIAHMQGQFDM